VDRTAITAQEAEQLAAERDHYRQLYLATLEQCRKLELGLRGNKRERLPPNDAQLTLGVLSTLLGREPDPDPEPPRAVKAHKRRRSGGRRRMPEHLPRVEIEILPPEVQREGLDAYERIGEDVRETVEYRPASTVVVRTRKPKFVRKDRERYAETAVLVADSPELPIEGGMAGPGLLANTIVRRWQDHLPLHRLESIYEREGFPLARSTICGWHQELHMLCQPLILAMWLDALKAPYLCTDATGVLVRDLEKCRYGHFWVVVAPAQHILFAYTPKHDKRAVDSVLGHYKGYLVADAHVVYDHLYADGEVIEVGCWAHARRYFFKSLATEPELAREGLALINDLFRIERAIATAPRKKRERVRADQSRPVVDRFFDWCDHQAATALDETPIARAVGYARNQRVALYRFLEDGRLPLDNNVSERQLRRQAIGRKNWLFVGSDEGGDVNATFVSLLASCQLHGLEPWAYIRDLLCLLPSWPAKRVLELAPAYWNQTLQNTDAQQRLDANVYRQITLGELDDHQPSS